MLYVIYSSILILYFFKSLIVFAKTERSVFNIQMKMCTSASSLHVRPPQQQFAWLCYIFLSVCHSARCVCCCTHKLKPATGKSSLGQGLDGKASAMKLENCNKSLSTGDKRNKNKVCGFLWTSLRRYLCSAAQGTGEFQSDGNICGFIKIPARAAKSSRLSPT